MIDLDDSALWLDEPTAKSAIEALFFAYRAFTDIPDRILDPRGLGRAHHRIIYFVGSSPELTVNQLLGVLKVTKQALNAPLRQLIEMGLIIEKADATDRRQKRLRLSATGYKLEKHLSQAQADWLRAHLGAATEEEGKIWLKLMQNLANAAK